jgi:hypothetical protein
MWSGSIETMRSPSQSRKIVPLIRLIFYNSFSTAIFKMLFHTSIWSSNDWLSITMWLNSRNVMIGQQDVRRKFEHVCSKILPQVKIESTMIFRGGVYVFIQNCGNISSHYMANLLPEVHFQRGEIQVTGMSILFSQRFPSAFTIFFRQFLRVTACTVRNVR